MIRALNTTVVGVCFAHSRYNTPGCRRFNARTAISSVAASSRVTAVSLRRIKPYAGRRRSIHFVRNEMQITSQERQTYEVCSQDDILSTASCIPLRGLVPRTFF